MYTYNKDGNLLTEVGEGRTGRYESNVFGVPYEGEMNLGYTGKPYDVVTGMYNYGYRDYSPEVARFTSEDPVRDGANWFAYVNNDPVNWIDPLGLETQSSRNKAEDEKEKTNTFLNEVLENPEAYTINTYERDAFHKGNFYDTVMMHSFYEILNNTLKEGDENYRATLSFNGTQFAVASTGAWMKNTDTDIKSLKEKAAWHVVEKTPSGGIDVSKTVQNIKSNMDTGIKYNALDHIFDTKNGQNCNTALWTTTAEKNGEENLCGK